MKKNRGNGAFGLNATSSRVSKGYKHRIWTRKRVTMVREIMGYRKERELVKSPWKQEKNRKTDGKLIKSLWKQKTNMKEEGELVRSLWEQEKTRERERELLKPLWKQGKSWEEGVKRITENVVVPGLQKFVLCVKFIVLVFLISS